MLFPTANRESTGVYIEGQQIGLRLVVLGEGTISISVIGMPSLTGFDARCRLVGDDLPEFLPTEIAICDTRLDCYAVDKHAPILRSGFSVELEPGMAQLLREWLPRLEVIAAESKAIAAHFTAQLAPPVYHMFSAITSVVGRILLAGWTVDHSIAYERKHGTWRAQEAFMVQFNDEHVIQRLKALEHNPTAHAHSGVTTI